MIQSYTDQEYRIDRIDNKMHWINKKTETYQERIKGLFSVDRPGAFEAIHRRTSWSLDILINMEVHGSASPSIIGDKFMNEPVDSWISLIIHEF